MASHNRGSTSDATGPGRRRRARAPETTNAIQPSRALVRWLHWALSRLADEAPAPSTSQAPIGARIAEARAEGSSTQQRRSASSAVPEEVRARFVRVGRDYHFLSGAQAFRDHGHKITSHSENVAVVRALVQIAAERGWSDIMVTGTERFRSEAWRIATLSGLIVRGYRPTEFEKQKLVGQVAAKRDRPAPDQSSAARRDRETEPTHVGILVEYGPAPYQFHPQGNPSYYVRIRTQEGERVLWGKDLERALRDAKVTAGEEIRIKQSGRDTVNVKRKELDSSGKVMKERDIKAHRNHWEIQGIVPPRNSHPSRNREGPGVATSLALKGAQLFAKQYIRDPAQRDAFFEAVREELTRIVDRGDVVPNARLRPKTRESGAPGRSV